MKFLFALATLLVVVSAIGAFDQDWQRFKTKFNKSYESDVEEHHRYNVFKANQRHTQDLNAKFDVNSYGVTKFSDLTPAEFKDMYLMNTFSVPEGGDEPKPIQMGSIPASFDWRDSSTDVVTAVYNQAQCGSCWAFSATETIESAWALAGNELTEFSMQQIVSCDTTSDGCGGGLTSYAYDYVIQAGGIESYSDYPYTSSGGRTGECKFDASDVVATISGFTWISKSPNTNETGLTSALLEYGPLSICADAESWQFYQPNTIITNNCPSGYDELDHCIQLIGWATVDNTDVWTIRNSWGTDWGNDGYLWVERGSNLCGIADCVTFPTVSS